MSDLVGNPEDMLSHDAAHMKRPCFCMCEQKGRDQTACDKPAYQCNLINTFVFFSRDRMINILSIALAFVDEGAGSSLTNVTS